MNARCALGALAAVAVLPAPAGASRVTFDRWDVGLRAAYHYWGGPPPCGTPRFEHHATRVDAEAWVTGDLTHPETMKCVIHLSERAERQDPGLACATVTHEVGHLRGLDHSENPLDVMFSGGPTWRSVWTCRRAMHRERYASACRRQRNGTTTECAPIYRWVLTNDQEDQNHA